MIVNEVKELVNLLASKDEGTGYISTLDFNRFSTMYQNEYLENKLSLGNNSDTFDIDSLSDFKKTSSVICNNGIISKPEDYRHFESAVYFDTSSSANGFMENTFEQLSSDEWNRRKTSLIDYPSKRFPMLKVEGEDVHIAPSDIQSISLTYVFNPPNVVWGTTQINGRDVWDEGTSTDFVFGKDEIHVIVYGICKLAGISFREGELTQVGMAEENKALQL